jgi:HSP20 family protein
MEKEDIQIDVTEDTLTIRGEKKTDKEHKGKDGYKRREQSYGAFSRSFTLPSQVKPGEAKASYNNGVLKIRLPKVKETQVQRVAIE